MISVPRAKAVKSLALFFNFLNRKSIIAAITGYRDDNNNDHKDCNESAATYANLFEKKETPLQLWIRDTCHSYPSP